MASPVCKAAETKRIWRIRVRCIAGRFWAYNSIAGDDPNATGNIDSMAPGAILGSPHWHQPTLCEWEKSCHNVNELCDPNVPFFTKLQCPHSFKGGELRPLR